MKKASEYRYLEAFIFTVGRCERIRTFDPLHPMQGKQYFNPLRAGSNTNTKPLFSLDNIFSVVSHCFIALHGLRPLNRTADRTANEHQEE